jgi:hypothetical protein
MGYQQKDREQLAGRQFDTADTIDLVYNASMTWPARILIGAGIACVTTFIGCDGCTGEVNEEDGGTSVVSCSLNSDCDDGEYCNEDDICVAGLQPGVCFSDADCPAEEECLIPEGSDVGVCINPHACDDASDCDADQECADADGDGYRDCYYPGCADDAECEIELGDTCPVNQRARCVARECICQDDCGAPCPEGQQCCAQDGTQPVCLEDPGYCSTTICDPGFQGVSETAGEWLNSLCDYDGTDCKCEERPHLPIGAIGLPHRLVSNLEGERYVVAYNSTYGDLVIGTADDSPVNQYQFIAGVPEVSEEAPIVAGPSGPRGGIEAPGADIGSMMDALFAPDGVLHIVAFDATSRVLRHIYGEVGGPFTERILDDVGDTGHHPQIAIDTAGRIAIAYVVRRSSAKQSILSLMAASSPTDPVSDFERYAVSYLDLTTIACEGGCDDGEVCIEAEADSVALCVAAADDCACGDTEVCTSMGCAVGAAEPATETGLVTDSLTLSLNNGEVALFGHNPRERRLDAYTQSGGSVWAGSAFFAPSILWAVEGEDVGQHPHVQTSTSQYLVTSTNVSMRDVYLQTYSHTLELQDSFLLDNGERVHQSGAIDDHAVDLTRIFPLASGSTEGGSLILWQDGTEGAVHGRVRASDGTLGPMHWLAGGRLDESNRPHFGLSINATSNETDTVLSAHRVALSAEPALQDVVLLSPPVTCPTDDGYEDNDDFATAHALGETKRLGGILCPEDGDEPRDAYSFAVDAGCNIEVSIQFFTDDGDLDLRLYDPEGNVIELSDGTTNSESITAAASVSGSYVAEVDGYLDASNAYLLQCQQVCDPVE